MEAQYYSGEFVPFYQTTRRHLPAYGDLNTQRRNSSDSYMYITLCLNFCSNKEYVNMISNHTWAFLILQEMSGTRRKVAGSIPDGVTGIFHW
jgi:hypothetical protein